MDRISQQLRLIGETAEIAKALGVEIWLRGGWAMDFFIGEPTREHEDIDWFAWGKDAAALTGALRGPAAPGPGSRGRRACSTPLLAGSGSPA